MQAVGRIGSYISKSVYTVSGTFHPFGGAVDIIVVEQPDGSYKSSPWYVRFGKFQGVLKSKEKVVGITVNDVEADFHMHLDSKGEAFFMQEVEMEEGVSAASPPYSSGEDMEGQPRWPLKSKSCNYDSKLYEPIVDERKALTRANTRQSQFFGFFGRRSPPEEAIDGKENAPDGKTQGSLEVAELAADLLDLRWSTNYGSPKCKKEKENNSSPVSDAVSTITEIDRNSVVDGSNHDEISLISQTSYQQVKSNGERNGVEIKSVTSEYIVSTSVGHVREHATLSDLEPAMKYSLDKPNLKVNSVGVVSEVAKPDSHIQDTIEKHRRLSDANFSMEENERDHTHSFYSSEISGSSGIELEVPFDEKSSSLCHGECREVCIHGKDQFTVVHEEKISVSGGPVCGASERLVTECYSQLGSRNPSTDSLKDIDSLSNAAASNSSYSTCVHMDGHNILGDKGKLDSHIQRSTSVPPCLGASKISEEELLLFGNLDDLGSSAKHLEYGESDHEGVESRDAKCCSISSLDQSDINDYTNDEYIDSRRLSSISSDVQINEINNVQPEGAIRMARSLPSMDCLIENLEASDPGYFSDASLYQDVNSCKEKKRRTAGEPPKPGYPPRCTDSRNGYFKRSTCLKVPDTTTSGENTNSVHNSNKNKVVESGKDAIKMKVNKKKVRTLTPTSKQLASLNLKDGKNVVIFTFSTGMLGKQQVDARIFLWRWDAKIVISDVDGTITRSDLLGQVMPLVGMDWLQTGVAHLFSAIKENGYQLLFLSARSISQSAITRQFLLNIKQDGKALPDGPIVISPDGLFPSLFREVVRRAPHEFKIACLEDIKALFPPDRNPYPFYAGFGNRDTDEVSYLKVGIPMGKIFIINPKGEIVVNHQVDTKSYMTLHSLVHGMFPNTFTCEQEDFNSWNFWKLPPPSILLKDR